MTQRTIPQQISPQQPLPPQPSPPKRRIDPKRAAPTVIAGALAIVYVIVSPPSFDLAAHLLRAKLGLGIWNNWWYGGHHTPGYSVLFPLFSSLLTPQVAAGIAATLTATLFELLARERFGPDAWLGAAWFGAATAINLFTGRLAFAFGLLPAVAAMLALQRRRPGLACGLAVVAALSSPVAALFAALGGVAAALGSYVQERRVSAVYGGFALAVSALLPVLALSVAFPEGGSEPFTFATLWPILIICAVVAVMLPRREWALRIGAVLYGLGCCVSYAVATPVGSNAARLGPLIAGPLAALIWWRRRPILLLLVAAPLIYIQAQAPVRDVSRSADDPSASVGYYTPLLRFLKAQPGPPFRVEIPFTAFHWEAYEVAPRFPLARGWERQLDIQYNHLFYGGPLNATTYHAWLRQLAVRFVAVSDASLDYSAHAEKALIDSGLPYLHLVMRSRHWRVYAVADPTPIVQGPATLQAMGADSLTIAARSAGPLYVRVRFTPYWTLTEGSGCVAKAGDFTRLTVRRPGTVRLGASFSLGRIGATSPRCT